MYSKFAKKALANNEGPEDKCTLHDEAFLYPENAQISSFFFSFLCNGFRISINEIGVLTEYQRLYLQKKYDPLQYFLY